MARSDTILAAIERIYQAGLDPSVWTDAFADVVSALGSRRLILVAQDPETQAVQAMAGFDFVPEQRTVWAGGVPAGQLAPFMNAMPTGQVLRSSRIVPDPFLVMSDFYNEGVRPWGDFYALLLAPVRTALSQVFVASCRPKSIGDFDDEDIAVLRAVAPHLGMALRVNERLAGADLRAAAADAALDRLDTGIVVTDSGGGVLFANAAAESVFARSDGLELRKDGILTSANGVGVAMNRMIASCGERTILGRRGGTLRIPRGDDKAPIEAIVAPIRDEEDGAEFRWPGARPAAMILLSDPEEKARRRRTHLVRRFGLTRAEIEVATEIARGGGRSAVAERLGITVATVRTHLSHIFDKTNVKRQAELVRLLSQADRAIGDDPPGEV